MSSPAPTGSNSTFIPVESSKADVIGIDPPSLVRSGTTPCTSSVAFAAATKFGCFGDESQAPAPCPNLTVTLLGDPSYKTSIVMSKKHRVKYKYH